MVSESVARRTAELSKVLLAGSLLLVLVWWRASVYLFVAGLVVHGLTLMMNSEAMPDPFTAPE